MTIYKNEEATRNALETLKARYPKETANLSMGNIDIDEDTGAITVWHDNGDRDFFSAEGEYIGSKQY